MLADVTRATFLSILVEQGVPHQFVKSENKVFLPEPSASVIFRSADNPTRLIGTNLAWFGVDELSYCEEDAWLRLEARLRDPRARYRTGFGCWTPNGFNWTYKRFISEEKPEDYEAICASPFENRAILAADPAFYERLKSSYDEKFYRQEVLGEYLDLFRGRAYYAFDYQMHRLSAVPFNPHKPLLMGMDFNVDPMSTVICQEDRGVVYVLDEISLASSNTQEMCEEFWNRIQPYLAEREKLYAGDVMTIGLYGDAAGTHRHSNATRSDYEIIREFFKQKRDRVKLSENVPKANPPVKDRVIAVNMMFKNGLGKSLLFVHSRCKELIADLREVVWKEGSSTELDKNRDRKRTHMSDALGYLIHRDYRVNAFQHKIYTDY